MSRLCVLTDLHVNILSIMLKFFMLLFFNFSTFRGKVSLQTDDKNVVDVTEHKQPSNFRTLRIIIE